MADNKKSSDEISRLNRKNLPGFAGTENKKRIVFLPHCLRNSKKCKAKEKGGVYLCVKCGACKIAEITKKAEELGYGAVYILKGGSILPRIMDSRKYPAALGVACNFEGLAGLKKCRELGIKSVCVPLSRDGCSDTDVSLDKLIKILKVKK